MRSLVYELIEDVRVECMDDRSGAILRGIPALEDVDPERFGICVATADGHTYEVGDTGLPFCIQSISKAFTYGIALTDKGHEFVDSKIDLEPSGDAFNEISLHPVTHRPRNPMINAGAIAACALVDGDTPDEQVARVSRLYGRFAGHDVPIDEGIYESQLESGHRNRAIAHMLREFGILEGDPNHAMEVYLRQCSTMVDCRDLALMGATLANSGTNPVTGDRVIADACTERVLSVMSTCGMYDAAGEWVAEVGMAAKSGVGGGILAVLPGQLSIAVFSPRLDSHGNSVRGVKACRRLSNELELHALHVARSAHSAVRDSYDIVEAPSALQRPVEDRRILDEHGRRARIFELHGDLLFAGAESVMRAIEAEGDGLEYLVLDVRQVDDVANITRRLLGGLRAALSEAGCQGMVVDPGGLLPGARWSSNGNSASHVFESLADATMWCEDQLLERYGAGARPTADRFKYAEHPLLSTVSEHTRKALRERMATRTYAGGDVIVAEGDPDASMFLILAGRVRSSLTTVAGLTRPLATLTPGTCFGDVYLATGTPHLTSMHADGPVECLELTREEFARINAEDSELRAALLWVFLASAHDDMDRSLRALANGRVTPMTSS